MAKKKTAAQPISDVKAKVENLLREVIDPEVGISVVDMGLIDSIEAGKNGKTVVKFHLTSPFCPMALGLARAIKDKLDEGGINSEVILSGHAMADKVNKMLNEPKT